MRKLNKFGGAIVGTALCASIALSGIGCKSVPTNDTMYMTSYAIGVASGMIANETKIDDASRNAVCEIMNIVVQCVPETNQTFEVAWTPIAKEHIAKLIADGKINEAQGRLIETAFSLAVQGLDYIFEVRYPKAKTYKELVVSAIDGFTDGFLVVFKPANNDDDTMRGAAFDPSAYYWLKRNAK